MNLFKGKKSNGTATPKKRERSTDWPKQQKQLLALKSQNLLDLEDSVLICDKGLRPNICRAAQAQGIKYLTIPYGQDKILVLRYRIKETK